MSLHPELRTALTFDDVLSLPVVPRPSLGSLLKTDYPAISLNIRSFRRNGYGYGVPHGYCDARRRMNRFPA